MKHNKLERRNFIKIGALGSLAALAAKATAAENAPDPTKIVYRTLGRTRLKVPVVSLGVMRADTPGIVSRSLEMGVLHLDTAHGYQDGRNEEMLGQLLKNYPRDKYIISTKIYMPRDKNTRQFTTEATNEKFHELLDISLKRLQLDYVDILYLHVCDNRDHVLHPDMLESMRLAKQQGKTQFTGVSTHHSEPEVIDAAIESKFYDIVLSAYNFKQKHHEQVRDALKRAHDAGLGTIVMKTMAGAYYDKERQKPINCTAALKWAIRHDFVHTSIPGASTFEEAEKNCAVMYNPQITDTDIKELEEGLQYSSLYCTGCGECTCQCPFGLPFNDIMRSYMYAYGYRDLHLAKKTIESLSLNADPCSNCTDCKVTNCPNGWDIRAKIHDILRIKTIPDEFIV